MHQLAFIGRAYAYLNAPVDVFGKHELCSWWVRTEVFRKLTGSRTLQLTRSRMHQLYGRASGQLLLSTGFIHRVFRILLPRSRSRPHPEVRYVMGKESSAADVAVFVTAAWKRHSDSLTPLFRGFTPVRVSGREECLSSYLIQFFLI